MLASSLHVRSQSEAFSWHSQALRGFQQPRPPSLHPRLPDTPSGFKGAGSCGFWANSKEVCPGAKGSSARAATNLQAEVSEVVLAGPGLCKRPGSLCDLRLVRLS